MTRRWHYQMILALLTLLTATEGMPVSELVFLLDRSGSVGVAHFEAEKGFVESFLAHVSVHPNASRVAVISYSDDAVVHVDYIRDPKSKCELQEELQGVEYADSRATNTRAALEKAREVLRNARPGVRKVVWLISDGVATAGGPPGEAATRLKKEGVVIYCVGVGRAAKEELMALASSPGHVYSCSGFWDFRRLAREIRGDSHESSWSAEKGGCDHLCDSPYRGEVGDPGCCDGHARCSCALKAGLRDCVCAPGYFGLSGLWGRCTPCPLGTYKKKLEPAAACTPCPKGSTTLGLASTSLQQCQCQEGFRGKPGEECSKVRCPPLQAPPRGFVMCDGSEFGSECVFGCEDGFELASPSDDVRTCLASGSWSGRTASCQRVQCSQPQLPPELKVRCTQSPPFSGTRCRFACSPGYLLQGSAERECLNTKRWSGEPPSCVPVTCPLPPKLVNGWSPCPSTKRPLFSEVCAYRCHNGFRLQGPPYLRCDADATLRPIDPYHYHQSFPSCIDVQPPDLLCPASQAVPARLGGGALVNWTVPLPLDNNPFGPPTLFPVYPLPKFLEVGTHTFQYVATDTAALTTACNFTVRVYDDEPPRVLSCPGTVELASGDRQAAVSWKEPLFEDISRFTVQQSRRPGDLFSQGEETVTYRAIDEFDNVAECTFKVKVSLTTCPYFPPPANGALSCDDLYYDSLCGVSCNEHFDFAAPPADLYVCNGEEHWVTEPSHMPLPWPDCTTAVSPGMLRLRAHGFYFSGDCRLQSTQMQIRKQFTIRLMRAHRVCFQRGVCSLDRVRVFCGTTRHKRDLFWPQGEDFELEFEITLHGDLQLNETEAVLQNFLEAIQHLGWEEEDETTTPSPEVNRTVVISEERAEVVCRPGSVLTNNKCLLCPSGTFFEGGQCSDCPVGHFQEQEGKEGCERCPPDTSTEQPRSRNHTDCKAICGPGTFSSNGLATCLACPLGTFQPLAGQSLCEFCPGTTTTLAVQSSSPQDCREKCAAGYFSEGGGLAPCSPCPLGFFQPSPEQNMCLECPRNLSTLIEAATDVAQCQEVDPCQSDWWCQHGGTCVPEGRRGICVCPEGWEGGRCEHDVDECLPRNPCLNGADCVNTEGSFQCSCLEGFSGELCGEELNECLSSPCLNNATCLDEVNGYRCVCGVGFYGARCEYERERCSLLDVECGHGGRCVDDGSGQTVCECTPGFSGVDCSIELDECQDVVCEHNGSCVNGKCACAPGYTGALCETDVDECLEGHRCEEGATCIDLVARYECLCPPGWAGVYCESRLSEDFVLNFPDPGSLANAASVRLRSALAQATVSLWVQTAAGGRDQATPLSYAAGVSDNAMTLSDCGALTLSLNNEPLLTDVAVHDGSWHHLAFAYDDTGSWRLWKDGALASEGQRKKGGAPVEGGGALVLGQEQDSLGGDFSPAETFTGNISRVNVWDVYLSPSNVTRLCQLDDDLPGKVVAWPDFLAGVSGDVRVLTGQLPTQDWTMQ